jgi:2-(1,2-epoxy-1,2-dihydrophenyl)acetyl-CoA isomerase
MGIEDDIACLTLDGASRRNALDQEFWESFADTLDALESAIPHTIVLTGEGEAFCAGGDVARMRESFVAMETGSFEDPERVRMDWIDDLLIRWASLPVPKIAAVNGTAVGAGLALAASCDYLIVAEDAFFDSGFSRLGLPGDMGATHYLARILGSRRAALWLLRARQIGSAEALAVGLADEVVSLPELLSSAHSAANALASGAPDAAAFILNRPAEVAALRVALDREREATLAAKQTPFHREAVERFFAKTG